MKRWLIVVSALFLAISAAASDRVSLQAENDFMCGEDDGYTHGTRIDWYSTTTDMPWESWMGDYVPEGAVNSGLALGQYIYTPRSKAESTLIEDDRAYGGLLYVGMITDVRSATSEDLFEADVGVVGEPSFAEETQTQIHEWIGSARPNGWAHQIKTEPGADLVYQKKFKYGIGGKGFGADVIPHAGGCLGSFFLYMDGGAMFRAGYNLPDDFGPLRMEPTARGVDAFSAYVFVDTEGKIVGHNIFLDGGTFRESHSVDRIPFTGEVDGGLCTRFQRFNLTYYMALRTKEYQEQDHMERFGGLSLGWTF